MITKFAIVLFASVCFAFPAEELVPASPADGPLAPQAVPPPGPQDLVPEDHLQDEPTPTHLLDGPLPAQVPAGGKPEDSDLKTDSSFWYRKSYYPIVYRRSYRYYTPRSYTYSYYTPYYSWWW